jgi:hypothetical protein
MYTQRPLVTTEGRTLPRSVPFHYRGGQLGEKQATQAVIVSVDNGNSAFKGAIQHAYIPALRTKRIVTAYAPAKTIRAGEGITTYQVNTSEPFWIGNDAMFTHHAESLPIGFTEERLPDQRYLNFFFACLVELLLEAGYGMPSGGEYDLYLSFGIPNEELDLKGLKETTRRALLSIFEKEFTIRRSDEQGQLTTWVLRLVEITPYPQSYGSFATYYYTLNGIPIETDIVKYITLDIGGGQLHSCQIDVLHQTAGRPKLRMSASLLGEGTIAIARAARETLRLRYPGVQLTDAEAQQMLVTRAVTVEGRRIPVDDLLSEVIASRSQQIFTQMRPWLDQQSFLLFTGGGSVLLEHSLRQLVSTRQHQNSFLFVPAELAPVLNAIGGYVLAQASVQKVAGQSKAVSETTEGR